MDLMRRLGARTALAAALLLGSGVASAGPTAPSMQQALSNHLRAQISDIEHHLDGVLGVAIVDLVSGEEFLIHPDEVFPQASSIKIALLTELYRQAGQAAAGEKGKARLEDLYTVRKEDVVQDSDILGGLTPGVTKVTNRDLATMVVAVSDNGATNVLIDRVGMANVNALMVSLGLPHTQLRRKMMDLKAASEGRENVSTPREMAALLKRLYRGEVLKEPLLDDFFTMLSTHKDSWLPRDLPEGVRVANKPGSLEGVRNDSGIVFLKNRAYVISVMCTYLTSERAGEEAISAISAATFSMFDRLDRASEYGRVISPSNGSTR